MALHVVELAQQYAAMTNASRAEIGAKIKQLHDELRTQPMPKRQLRLGLLRLRLLVDEETDAL